MIPPERQRFYAAIKTTMKQHGIEELTKTEHIFVGALASFFEEHIELARRVKELESHGKKR